MVGVEVVMLGLKWLRFQRDLIEFQIRKAIAFIVPVGVHDGAGHCAKMFGIDYILLCLLLVSR